jgi:hypothetical protein
MMVFCTRPAEQVILDSGCILKTGPGVEGERERERKRERERY